MDGRDTEVLPGQILAGKFRIEQVLGRGGMGVVVAATHIQLEERVAIKFLLPEALKNAEAVRRFEREARAAVKIKSEHVARVTDVGQLETGSPYMVMEYLSGMDLGQYLERHGALTVTESADYLLQACDAIAEAHSMGIVHRDLKPANLFRIVRSDGTPSIKVLDFGISKVAADNSMTMTSSMMGSPYYMSPEQMTSSKTVDHRTDIWALGVILYELLTGKVPYGGDTVPEVCAQVLTNPPPNPAELNSEVPPELSAVIARCLSKQREERFDDVAAFAMSLVPFGSENASFVAARISRVLGVTQTVSPSRVTRQTHSNLGAAAGATSASSTSASGTKADAVDPGAMTTLGGSANTQELDLAPPTKKAPTVAIIGAAAAAILLVGGGVLALAGRGNEEPGFEANAAGPALGTPEETLAPQPERPAAKPTEVAPLEPPPEATKPAEPSVEPETTKPAASKPATSKPTASKPATSKPTTTPATAQPEAKPSETKPPETKPQPAKPSQGDLLLDRK